MDNDRRRHQRIAVTPLPAPLTEAQKVHGGDFMVDDRRRFQRVATALPATLGIADQLISGIVHDISRSGAAVELDDPLSLMQGARVVLAGNGTVPRASDAKVVAGAGNRYRLVFEPTLSAMELVGLARKLGR